MHKYRRLKAEFCESQWIFYRVTESSGWVAGRIRDRALNIVAYTYGRASLLYYSDKCMRIIPNRKIDMKKLYEFTALLKCSLVVAADSEEQAREEIKTFEAAWYETGDVVGVVDVDLFDVRDPSTQNPVELKDLAHIITKDKAMSEKCEYKKCPANENGICQFQELVDACESPISFSVETCAAKSHYKAGIKEGRRQERDEIIKKLIELRTFYIQGEKL